MENRVYTILSFATQICCTLTLVISGANIMLSVIILAYVIRYTNSHDIVDRMQMQLGMKFAVWTIPAMVGMCLLCLLLAFCTSLIERYLQRRQQ